jgi:hypothetical protein
MALYRTWSDSCAYQSDPVSTHKRISSPDRKAQPFSPRPSRVTMATTPALIPCTQAEAAASCSGAVESGCSGVARSEPQASSTTNLGWSFCPLFLSKFINRFLFSFIVPLPHTIFFLDQKLPWVALKKVTYFLQRFFPRSVLYPVLIMIGLTDYWMPLDTCRVIRGCSRTPLLTGLHPYDHLHD